MRSLYKDFTAKLVEYIDLSEFSTRIEIAPEDWLSVVRDWRKALSHRFEVAEFTLGKEPEIDYINNFRSWCGLSEVQQQQVNTAVVNPGISQKQVDFAKAVAQYTNEKNKPLLQKALRLID